MRKETIQILEIITLNFWEKKIIYRCHKSFKKYQTIVQEGEYDWIKEGAIVYKNGFRGKNLKILGVINNDKPVK